jgi:hypothetical protein
VPVHACHSVQRVRVKANGLCLVFRLTTTRHG